MVEERLTNVGEHGLGAGVTMSNKRHAHVTVLGYDGI